MYCIEEISTHRKKIIKFNEKIENKHVLELKKNGFEKIHVRWDELGELLFLNKGFKINKDDLIEMKKNGFEKIDVTFNDLE